MAVAILVAVVVAVVLVWATVVLVGPGFLVTEIWYCKVKSSKSQKD